MADMLIQEIPQATRDQEIVISGETKRNREIIRNLDGRKYRLYSNSGVCDESLDMNNLKKCQKHFRQFMVKRDAYEI